MIKTQEIVAVEGAVEKIDLGSANSGVKPESDIYGNYGTIHSLTLLIWNMELRTVETLGGYQDETKIRYEV